MFASRREDLEVVRDRGPPIAERHGAPMTWVPGPGRATVARAWHAAIAVAVAFALVLQVIITYHASATPPGHAVGTLAGAPFGTRLVRVISFFTIQSNVLAGVVSAQLALDPRRDGAVWRAVRLAALVGITVTGVVYSTVLARIHEPRGWDQTVSNAVVHYLVPVLMVLGWLLFGPRPRIDASTIARAAVWPVGWLGYTLVRGELTDWYPYPFVDAATQGYARVHGERGGRAGRVRGGRPRLPARRPQAAATGRSLARREVCRRGRRREG